MKLEKIAYFLKDIQLYSGQVVLKIWIHSDRVIGMYKTMKLGK